MDLICSTLANVARCIGWRGKWSECKDKGEGKFGKMAGSHWVCFWWSLWCE